MHARGTMPEHGDRGRYTKHGCRCDLCRRAQADYMADWRERRKGEGKSPRRRRLPPEHGTRAAYKTCTAGAEGGKCAACQKANRDYQRVYMQDWRDDLRWED